MAAVGHLATPILQWAGAVFAAAMTSPLWAEAVVQPYAVPHSRIVDVPSASNGVDYQLYVHVPPACTAPEHRCPTVYLLDAEYSFPLVSAIVTHLADRDRIPPLVSVSIGYPDKSNYRRDRTRDYTPFFHPDGGYGREMQKVSGGGPAFLSVLTGEIVPFVERSFPSAGQPRTLVGHSYGGLFAVHAWIQAPHLFERYVVVSPSLWYADGEMLDRVEQACSGSAIAQAQWLYLAVGEHEDQPENGRAMVADLRTLGALLEHCDSRKTSVELRVFLDETHASVFPAALSSGLRALFQ